MTGKDGTTVDDDIGTGNTAATAVGVLTALDADTIVASIEARVDNQSVGTRLQVEGIAILGVGGVTHEYIIYNNILAHQRMKVPRGGVLEDDALEQHVLTVDEAHHDGTQEPLHSLPFLFGLGGGNVHVRPLFALGIPCGWHPVVFLHLLTAGNSQQALPVAFRDFGVLHGTPVLAISVDDAMSRDADIGSTIGREWRLTATGVKALEGCLDKGIEVFVGSKLDDGTSLQVQVDI